MKLQTNLNHGIEESRKSLRSACISAQIALCVLLVLTGWGIAAMHRGLRMSEATVAELAESGARLAEQAKPFSTEEIESCRQRIAFCNELIASLNHSPVALLSLLEDSLPPQCSVTSLRLDADKQVCLLEIESGSVEDVNRFFTGLKEFKAIQDAMIVSQSRLLNSGVKMVRTSCQLRLAGPSDG